MLHLIWVFVINYFWIYLRYFVTPCIIIMGLILRIYYYWMCLWLSILMDQYNLKVLIRSYFIANLDYPWCWHFILYLDTRVLHSDQKLYLHIVLFNLIAIDYWIPNFSYYYWRNNHYHKSYQHDINSNSRRCWILHECDHNCDQHFYSYYYLR